MRNDIVVIAPHVERASGLSATSWLGGSQAQIKNRDE
jgi:hypothetical protein